MTRGMIRSKGSRQLLATLLDNPDLPAFVRQLPAPELKQLIDHVGLEDAGELIALTEARQLRDVFEATLWHSLTPGQADTPKAGEFLRWLNVMFAQGPAFAAQRLRELGLEFVAANLRTSCS
jgi:hypothetical protein